MGKLKGEKERLNQALTSHMNTIHETFQLLDQTPSSSLTKLSWEEVLKMGDQVSKQATVVGMLWTGEGPDAKAIEENMVAYFNTLQGFHLLSQGSKVGAGPTLSSSIHSGVKQIVDCSFKLMVETVSSYGSCSKDLKLTVPQLVGAVWEACSALKKTPATNIIAIGRAMTKVAVSVKDVLREMKELKLDSANLTEEASEGTSMPESRPDGKDDDDNSSVGELGNDLSPEEMQVAQMAIGIVSETVIVIKELIRTLTGLVKLEKPGDSGNFVNSLENLLKLCQDVGLHIDEVGACLYPPQEVPAIKAALAKISSITVELQSEVENFKSSSEAFFQACNGLMNSIKQMESELDCCSTTDIEAKMDNVALGD